MHAGFQFAIDMVVDSVIAAVAVEFSETGARQVVVSGHSLGGALATLLGHRIATDPGFDFTSVSVVSFGA